MLDTKSTANRYKWRVLRFSLRSALAGVLMLSAPLAYLSNQIHCQHAKRDAFHRLLQSGIELQDDREFWIDAAYLPPRPTYWESCQCVLYGKKDDLPIVRRITCVRADRRTLDDFASNCHYFPVVESLVLAGSPVTDRQLRRFNGYRRLRRLDLAASDITDAGLNSVRRINNLESLILDATAVTDAGVEKLFNLKLASLSLVDSSVTQAGHAKLIAALPDAQIHWRHRLTEKHQASLRQLVRSGVHLAAHESQHRETHLYLDSSLEGLASIFRKHLPELDGDLRISLHFGGQFNDADVPGLQAIVSDPKTKRLTITIASQATQPVTQDFFDVLGQGRHLEELNLEGVWHESKTVAVLPLNYLDNLQRLRWVNGASVSWRQLVPLLGQLNAVEGDWELLFVAGHLNCESLRISGSGPVDADIVELLRLNERLKSLDLSQCDLTPHALYRLADLTWLQSLRIQLPPNSEQTFTRLRNSLEHCEITVVP